MKKYIKLNIDDNHLSWGNFTRIIKEHTINKTSALQVEIFCTIFDIPYIGDTTVNNYCTGIRGINDEYKQKYGSDAYGLTAFILNGIRIYSIPFCFLGIDLWIIW